MNKQLQLFDDINRIDFDASSHSEPRFSYLNRTARPVYSYIREILQDWFDAFDGNSIKREKLRKEFRSRTDHEHLDAFFELYLNNLFKVQGFKVQVEPQINEETALWTKNNPDFLLTTQTGEQLLVEAASIYPPHEFGGEKQRFRELIDSIQAGVNSPDFWISMGVNASSSQRPALSRICNYLKRELSKLNYEDVKREIDISGMPPQIHWKDSGWDLDFWISTKNMARGDTEDGSLGIYTDGIKQIDTLSPIQNTIKKKNDRYGDLKIPYLLAVNVHTYVDDLMVPDALLGRVHRANGQVRWLSDGSWYKRSIGYSMRRMSGLAVVAELRPDTLTYSNPVLWHHPDPNYLILPQWWKLPQRIFDKRLMDYLPIDGVTAAQLLNIDSDKMPY